jgi:hypothetical protein
MFLNKTDSRIRNTSLPTLFSLSANALSRVFIMGKFSYWLFFSVANENDKEAYPSNRDDKDRRKYNEQV